MRVYKDILPEHIFISLSRIRSAFQRKSFLTAVILPILGLVIAGALAIFLTLRTF